MGRQIGGPGNVAAPAANTAAVVTLTCPAGHHVRVRKIYYSYDAAPTGGNLSVDSSSGNMMDLDLPGSEGFPGGVMPDLIAPLGEDVSVTLAAGGAGVSGRLNVTSWDTLMPGDVKWTS